MKVNHKYIIAIVLIIVVAIILGAVVLLIKNTSFLIKPTPEQVAENNNNQEPDEELQTDFVTLVPTQVSVSEEFKNGAFSGAKSLNVPEGFQISVWMNGISGARAMDFTDGNNLVVTAKDEGVVYLIKNNREDNQGGEKVKIDSNLRTPHGIDFYNGDLYVAEENQVIVYRGLDEDGKFDSKEVIVSNLPVGGHSTRTVLVGPDQKLYVSIGSSCNVCEESDERRAAIMQYDLDGSNAKVFASGLRNTVDFISKPTDSTLRFWGVDNGRDQIGDDIPPEEVNIIREGNNYGWPYCYGNQIPNPEYSRRTEYCMNETELPLYNMQAHSAPLGLTFVPKSTSANQVNFPEFFEDDLFITFHGSWNRSVPTGYKVVRINSVSSQSEPVNFITGWLDSSGDVWGRPVGIRFDASGAMFISDDVADVIYKVQYLVD